MNSRISPDKSLAKRSLLSKVKDFTTFESYKANHTNSPTSARIRVKLNSFDPLIKQTILAFPNGEEKEVTLVYERLDKNCLFYSKLTHEEKDCPDKYQVTRDPTSHMDSTVFPFKIHHVPLVLELSHAISLAPKVHDIQTEALDYAIHPMIGARNDADHSSYVMCCVFNTFI